jgi:hypothetical protein
MLRKLLPDYPEDVIRRPFQYQYRKLIDVYSVTKYEVELLNRINSHHSRWTYSQQPFTKQDEIIRVSDFLPFYEHLRHASKSASNLSTLRQLLPQSQQNVQRTSDLMSNMPTILRTQSTMQQGTSAPTPSYPLSTNFSRENTSVTSRPIVAVSTVPRPPRPAKSVGNPYAVAITQRPAPCPPLQPLQPTPSMSINTTNFTRAGK